MLKKMSGEKNDRIMKLQRPKKNNKKSDNYRDILLLDVVYKKVEMLIKEILQDLMEKTVRDYQVGLLKWDVY